MAARTKRRARASKKGSPPVVGEGGGRSTRTLAAAGHTTTPGPGSPGGDSARASLEAGEAPPPSGRQQCAEVGIVPRAVVMRRRTVGVVLEVSEDGEITVAFTHGRLRTCTRADSLEVVAGPNEPHDGRWDVLEQWQQRPPDWPDGRDNGEARAFLREAWEKLDELLIAHGFTLYEDLIVRLIVHRPVRRVPLVLNLTPQEYLRSPNPIPDDD